VFLTMTQVFLDMLFPAILDNGSGSGKPASRFCPRRCAGRRSSKTATAATAGSPSQWSIPRSLSWSSTAPRLKPVRILCLDGGGGKGIGIAKVLESMEKSLGRPLSDLYDFVIGSSIGAIVLAGYLNCGFSFEDFEHNFSVNFSRFAKDQSTLRLLWTGSTQDRRGQEALLNNTFQGRLPESFDLASTAGGVHMCITVTSDDISGQGQSLELVRNYGTDTDWSLQDALMATSAFPVICPPILKDGISYRDGGLLANNPSMEALVEVDSVWPNRPIAFLHSIGANANANDSAPIKPIKKSSSTDSLTSLISSVSHTGQTDKHSRLLLKKTNPSSAFRRLDLPLAHHAPFLSDERAFSQIVEETLSHLQVSSEYQDMLRDHGGSDTQIVGDSRSWAGPFFDTQIMGG